MQEVNRLHDWDRDDADGDADGDGLGDDHPETVSMLRKVLEMAAEGHDAEMREDFERRHRNWHSVRTQYVGAMVDNAVARLARKSQATVSEAEREAETTEDLVRRIAADIDPEN